MDLADLSALLGQQLPAEANAGMWVVLPGAHGADLARSGGAALIGEARRLADGMGCRVQVVLDQSESGEAAIAGGADRAVVAADVFGWLAGQQPEFVLLPAGCEALAGRLAQHWGAGLVNNVARELSLDP